MTSDLIVFIISHTLIVVYYEYRHRSAINNVYTEIYRIKDDLRKLL